jgi:AraC-like DNA-binding protein
VLAVTGKVVTMDGTASVRIARDLGGLELIEAVHHRPNFPRHSHPTYAIGVVRAGANRFRYRGAFHTAPAGTLCTVTPDEAHSVEPAGDQGFAYWCLYPSLELVTGTAEAVGGKRPSGTLVLPPVIEDAEAARLLCAVFEAEAAIAPRMAREARLLALLSHVLVRHATASVVVRGKPASASALARAHDFLAACSAENMSLGQLAAMVGLDPFALVRGFTRAYGLPPHAWLIQERVRRAQACLRAGLSPAAVAAEVGFADQSHLCRHFKRIVGVTPGLYRRAASTRDTV